MRTRRGNKIENKKTKQMLEVLEHAEKTKSKEIEGELPDMPVLEEDGGWGENQKNKSKKEEKSGKNDQEKTSGNS